MRIRAADPLRDAAACAAIYAPYVTDSVASFEYDPPDAKEMSLRMSIAHEWLVAEGSEGEVVGYAYGSKHKQRAAYQWAADVAVYVAASAHRAGVGRALYTELFPLLVRRGIWTLCAGITQPNAASVGLHLALGFEPVGTYRRIGWKAGAWHDVTWFQLELRPGDGARPE